MTQKKKNIAILAAYILSAEAIGFLSSWLAGDMNEFYSKYPQPPLQPPAWVFPVVWIALYALMGIGAYLVHIHPHKDGIKTPLTLYWAQLAVNFSWTVIFFRFAELRMSIAVILLLLGLIAYMLYSFSRHSKTAAYINIPYFIWTAFATYLNIATAVLAK